MIFDVFQIPVSFGTNLVYVENISGASLDKAIDQWRPPKRQGTFLIVQRFGAELAKVYVSLPEPEVRRM